MYNIQKIKLSIHVRTCAFYHQIRLLTILWVVVLSNTLIYRFKERCVPGLTTRTRGMHVVTYILHRGYKSIRICAPFRVRTRPIQIKTIKQKHSYISSQQELFNNRILRMTGTHSLSLWGDTFPNSKPHCMNCSKT